MTVDNNSPKTKSKRYAGLTAAALTIAILLPLAYHEHAIGSPARTKRYIIGFSTALAAELQHESGELQLKLDRVPNGGEDEFRLIESWLDAAKQHVELVGELSLHLKTIEMPLRVLRNGEEVAVEKVISGGVARIEAIKEAMEEDGLDGQRRRVLHDNVKREMQAFSEDVGQISRAIRAALLTQSVGRSLFFHLEDETLTNGRSNALEDLNTLTDRTKTLTAILGSLDFNDKLKIQASIKAAVDCCKASREAFIHTYSLADGSKRYRQLENDFVASQEAAKKAVDGLIERFQTARSDIEQFQDIRGAAVKTLRGYSGSIERRIREVPQAHDVISKKSGSFTG